MHSEAAHSRLCLNTGIVHSRLCTLDASEAAHSRFCTSSGLHTVGSPDGLGAGRWDWCVRPKAVPELAFCPAVSARRPREGAAHKGRVCADAPPSRRRGGPPPPRAADTGLAGTRVRLALALSGGGRRLAPRAHPRRALERVGVTSVWGV